MKNKKKLGEIDTNIYPCKIDMLGYLQALYDNINRPVNSELETGHIYTEKKQDNYLQEIKEVSKYIKNNHAGITSK